MKQYNQFVDSLNSLFSHAKYDSISCRDEIQSATNGLAKSELYRLVPIRTRRKYGAFFTDEATAKLAAKFLKREIEQEATICDPACGAGDLLLACTDYMRPARDLRSTLRIWGRHLIGWDLHQAFVDACRLRLALKCIERSQSRLKFTATDPEIFERIGIQDGLLPCPMLQEVDAVIMNPPFTTTRAPNDIQWGHGGVSASALFVDKVLGQVSPGTKLVAILPDVLRSGTSYSQWRKQMSQVADINHIVTLQQFDPSTDVHVFILVATKKNSKGRAVSKSCWLSGNQSRLLEGSNDKHTVGSLFNVSVGPVVEYREPNLGAWLPYLTARGLPAWTNVEGRGLKKRRFRGRKTKAPFVVVRRTSRPEDQHRAIATVICGHDKYAVENHLMIFEPKDGKLDTCQSLLDILKHPETSEFLNRVIRCRHLTVSAVESIPWIPLREQQ